jgi:RNA polymerase sigma-70 factor (ECF subfamily)
MSTHAEDLALVEAFRRGEESAFTALAIKYREPIYRIARRMVHSHEDASDVTQEVFIRVYRALPRFAGRAHLRTWLFRITINLCLDFAARRSRDVPTGLHHPAKEPAAHPDDGPAERVERRELGETVARAIELLPPRQRAMVVLRVYQDLPYADISRIMGCAEGTVKATMFAAFAKLRTSLAAHDTSANRARGTGHTG